MAEACGGQIRFSRSGGRNAATHRPEGAKRLEKKPPYKQGEAQRARAEVICSPGDEGDGRADYWSTPSGAEQGEPAEAGPQKRPEDNHSVGACGDRMIIRRERRDVPTGGEPTTEPAKAGLWERTGGDFSTGACGSRKISGRKREQAEPTAASLFAD